MRVDRENVDNLLDLNPSKEVNVALDTTDLPEDAVLDIINRLSEKGLVWEVWHNHPDLDFTVDCDDLETMRWIIIDVLNEDEFEYIETEEN